MPRLRFVLLLVMPLWGVSGDAKGDTFPVGPADTFLSFVGASGTDPVPVSLADVGASPGDILLLEQLGEVNWCCPPDCLGCPNIRAQFAVFSTTDVLLPDFEIERVPGAIDGLLPDGGPLPEITVPSCGGCLTYNIPQDFSVTGQAGVCGNFALLVRIPEDGAFLFVGVPDGAPGDNTDNDNDFAITITRITGDCNDNCVGDGQDIAAGTSPDCNGNGVPDECEIAENSSAPGGPFFCTENCDPDCNVSGVPDECELECNDCNKNLVPDDCDAAPFTAPSGPLGPFGDGAPQSFTIASPPVAFTDVTFSFTAVADFGDPDEFVEVELNGVPIGPATGELFDSAQQCASPPSEDGFVISDTVYNNAVNGGDAVITMTGSSTVDPAVCGAGVSFISVSVEYLLPPDSDGNGLPDECEAGPYVVQGAFSVSFDDHAWTGYIDPKGESSDGVLFDMGLDRITLVFSEQVYNVGGGALSSSAFSVTQTNNNHDPPLDPPNVECIEDLGVIGEWHFVTVVLDRILTVQEWTTIIADVEDLDGNMIQRSPVCDGNDELDRVTVGFLPADVDQDELVGPFDVLRFREYVNGVNKPPQGVTRDFVDLDRDGIIDPFDLLLLRQLILGVSPAARVWAGETLEEQPSCCSP